MKDEQIAANERPGDSDTWREEMHAKFKKAWMRAVVLPPVEKPTKADEEAISDWLSLMVDELDHCKDLIARGEAEAWNSAILDRKRETLYAILYDGWTAVHAAREAIRLAVPGANTALRLGNQIEDWQSSVDAPIGLND